MFDTPLIERLLLDRSEEEKQHVEKVLSEMKESGSPSTEQPRHFVLKLVAEAGNVFYAYEHDGVMMLRVAHVSPNGTIGNARMLEVYDEHPDILYIDTDFKSMALDWTEESQRQLLIEDALATKVKAAPVEATPEATVDEPVEEVEEEVEEFEPLCPEDVEGLVEQATTMEQSEADFDAATQMVKDMVITERDDTENIEEDDNARPYIPASLRCRTLETIVPNSMRFEIFRALQKLDANVRGVDEYVAMKLGYITDEMSEADRELGYMEFCSALASEQVDGVALGIYNIEVRDQSIIIADQTGIGKGRQAAAILRYAHHNNKPHIPVFVTEKPNLFSDIFRDMIDIHSDAGIPRMRHVGETDISFEKFMKRHGRDIDDTEELQEIFDQENIKEDVYKENKNFAKEIEGKKRMIPFILNGASEKSQIKDSNKNIIYRGSNQEVAKLKKIYKKIKNTQERRAAVQKFLEPYDIVLATYSQFNTVGWKQAFLEDIAEGNIMVLDESHTAGGSAGGKISNTSLFFRKLLTQVKGVCFLSATYSKTPNNMPIYAEKTSIKESGLENATMISAFKNGGTALQEIVSSQLTSEGQLIRREKSFKDVETRYTYLNETQDKVGRRQFNLKSEHEIISDNIMDMYRKILDFQRDEILPVIKEWHDQLMEFIEALTGDNPMQALNSLGYNYSNQEIQDLIKYHSDANINKKSESVKDWSKIGQQPVTASFFNFYNQMLFSLKAEAVADLAIDYMKKGRKPFIAIANTMEAFLSNMKDEKGRVYQVNEEIPFDFNMVLLSILEKTLYYVERDVRNWESYGDTTSQRVLGARLRLDLPSQISAEAQRKYNELRGEILRNMIGIPNSPIDYVLHRIRQAGFSVEEITGRSLKLDIKSKERAIIRKNRLKPVNIAFSEFNQNKIDCVVVNQVGATGASAHAIEMRNEKGEKIVEFRPRYNPKGELLPPDSLEPKDEVKQRVMLVLQAELDINKEVQKRGRINRTGQVYVPAYEYVSTAIPAEQRIMMMLQRKMKSLDANTTGNQRQSKAVVDIQQADQEDFLNKYGDEVVLEWIDSSQENKDFNYSIGEPIGGDRVQDAAHKFTGKVGIASVKQQQRFYDEINPLYREEVEYQKALGEYDLEVEKMDLQAKTLDRLPAIVGKGGSSVFGKDSVLEHVEINPIKKPYTKLKLDNTVKAALVIDSNDGSRTPLDPMEYIKYYESKINIRQESLIEEAIKEITTLYESKIENIDEDREIKKKEDQINNRIQKNLDKIAEIEESAELNELDKETKIKGLEAKNAEIEAGRAAEMEEKKQARIQDFRDKINEQSLNARGRFEQNASRIIDIMREFPIGTPFFFPAIDYKESNDSHLAVCTGYKFSENEENPYVPSKVRVLFAIASAQVSIEIPLSKEELTENGEIQKAKNARFASAAMLDQWDDIVQKYTGRVKRYIVTGNILQAMGNTYLRKGRLIKYTLHDKGIKEGILLPPNFDPYGEKFREKLKISIPLSQARPVLETLNVGERVSLVDYRNNLQSYLVERHFTGNYIFSWDSALVKGKRVANKGEIQKEAESDITLMELTFDRNSQGVVTSKGVNETPEGTYTFISNQKLKQLRFPADNIEKVIDYGIDAYDWRIMITFTQFNKIKDNITLNIDEADNAEISRMFALLFEKEREYELRLQAQKEADRGAPVDIVTEEPDPETVEDVNDLIEENEALKAENEKQTALKEIIKATDLIIKMGEANEFRDGGAATAHEYVKDQYVEYVNVEGNIVTGRVEGYMSDSDKYAIDNGGGIELVTESYILQAADNQEALHAQHDSAELTKQEKDEIRALLKDMSVQDATEIAMSTYATNKHREIVEFIKAVQ